MSAWSTRLGLTREALFHSLRTAIAAVVSTLLARSVKLPEFYWAPISTIVILLSVTDPLALAWQRFVGTALGAVLGALIATYFNANWMVYGAGILVCGLLSAVLRLGSAYRFAAITLTIVLLITHGRPLDRRQPPLRGGVAGNRGGASGHNGVASAGAKVEGDCMWSRATRPRSGRVAWTPRGDGPRHPSCRAKLGNSLAQK